MVLWLCQVRAVVSALVLLFLLGLLLVDGGALYHCMPTRVNLLGLMPVSALPLGAPSCLLPTASSHRCL